MTVKDLKKLLMDVDDDMQVLIPMTGEFDGYFKSPCNEESGVNELGISDDSDETEKSFLLVPCCFFEESKDIPCELN